MIDKYTIFNNLSLDDFYYIIHILAREEAIQINDKNLLDKALMNVLTDYAEDEDSQ